MRLDQLLRENASSPAASAVPFASLLVLVVPRTSPGPLPLLLLVISFLRTPLHFAKIDDLFQRVRRSNSTNNRTE